MRAELFAPDSLRWVYSIRCSRNRVRYVGVTSDVDVRASCHANAKTPIGEFIREQERRGKPCTLVIECKTTYQYASATESAFIAKYASKVLLNQVSLPWYMVNVSKQGTWRRTKREQKWLDYLAAKQAAKEAKQTTTN